MGVEPPAVGVSHNESFSHNESVAEPVFAPTPVGACLERFQEVILRKRFIYAPDNRGSLDATTNRAKNIYKLYQATQDSLSSVVWNIDNAKVLLACLWIAAKNEMYFRFKGDMMGTIFQLVYPDYHQLKANELSRVERHVLWAIDWRILQGEIVPHDAGTRRRREEE